VGGMQHGVDNAWLVWLVGRCRFAGWLVRWLAGRLLICALVGWLVC